MINVFNKDATNHLTAAIFFDPNGSTGIARYDKVKYAEIEHTIQKQIGFLWNPEEVDINKDRVDFSKLEPYKQHIFTSNLKRQILLDSVQGRAPTMVFGPISGVPEMETWATVWSFSEVIHSRSYSHIIREVYAQSGLVFDEMSNIPEIIACADDISHYYNDFLFYSSLYQLFGYGKHNVNGVEYDVNEYDLKKKLWLCIMSVNILEGIRFYVSFACSWAFAENKLMEGNAKIIRFICRDENLHLGMTQRLLRTILPGEDPIYAKIRQETRAECVAMFKSAINQEKEWAKYLFKDGTIIGLNEALLCKYIDYIASHRLRAVGLPIDFEAPTRNPLPWTDSWISSKSGQPAPQETEISSYILGGMKQDVEKTTFSSFKL